LWVIGGVYEPLRNSHKRNVHNIPDADCNIHAGSKMLHSIQQNYFNDPALDLTNKTLLTFAAYNAGPARISRVRRRAKEEGLDPNQWFGNVELVVAQAIGQETIQSDSGKPAATQ
jgi:membrane-bound lytic murein transglycosylase MltF